MLIVRPKDLYEKVSGVKNEVVTRFGEPLRMKVQKLEEMAPLPRILLNLDFCGLICEVQIRLRLKGMDILYQDFVHDVYEWLRTPYRNPKHLVKDMVSKGGVKIPDDWILGCREVEFTRSDKGNPMFTLSAYDCTDQIIQKKWTVKTKGDLLPQLRSEENMQSRTQ
eukprot:TRINITY_DN8_c0_g2_i2.p2 TRINITY_DN8_c0_g2~~TRINITY_DN8_c0_g2_i2.p2  ORF type:complete len:166 (-),score=39.98 TRINITY_DN8_c0_g2_i2:120-617(-)